jgi:Protein of unknown function (DUF1549)/Protein of unknown function (DUF1553)
MFAANMTRPWAQLAAVALFTLFTLFLALPARAAAPAPVKEGEKVDFERHIMGLLGRLGCNAGSCHGSFQGKGGFRLSLFGYDPEMDYAAITRDSQARRINRTDPDNSLFLLKPTGQIAHGGGRRFSKDSWQYQMFREWIVSGMSRDAGSGTVKQVSVSPPEHTFKKLNEKLKLIVKATFADGSSQDITALTDFRTNDEAVAVVASTGEVESRRPGDTTIVVSYRGTVLPVRMLVPMTPPPGFKYPKVAEVNYIDKHVQAKLRRLNIAPSDLSSDAAFLRRVTLDTIGMLPAPEEVRKFLADKDPKKREKKIEELLAHPLHAALWATKFCDITGNNTDSLENPQQLKPKFSQMWHDWFRKRVQENVPYDQIVHDVLCATSRDGKSPEEYIKEFRGIAEAAQKGFESKYKDKKTLDLFWRKQQRVPPEQWGEKTAVAFLGVRVECAQCHKHPFDRWTQEDYWAYANVFSTVNFGISPEARNAINKANADLRKGAKRNNQVPQLREVFLSGRPVGRRPNPTTNKPLSPKTLGGPEISVEADKDPREALFAWMRSPENPFFARSFVNRVWGHYFGIGIVHPVDDFSLGNPPSNPALLDALAKDFIDSGFDIRKLEKKVLLSRTYQTSSVANPTNHLDTNNYSRSYVRPLMAEVVVDIVNDALGTKETFGVEAPSGARAIEVGSTRIQNASLREAFRVFGRSPRTVACDCERATEPTVAHKLYLMADPTLQAKMNPARNRLRPLLADKNLSDDQVTEELFLAALSRLPTAKEKAKVLEYVKTKGRQTAFTDTLWALINTTEFVFNH